MSIDRRRVFLAASVCAALMGVCGPVLSEAHPGGGGGGGHGGGAHAGGGGHAAVAHAGSAHFSAGAHYGAATHYAPAGRSYGGGVAHSYGGGLHVSAYGGRGGYGYPGSSPHGYSTGAYWRGGYWRGGYWPRAYYGGGYAWFLPILPLAYATYWYGGVPYYYANDVYYTWNPSYDGYTATDPPPVSDASVAGDEGAAVQPTVAPSDPGPGPGGGQIFMYPKNGQSEAQQSEDRRACQQWAASQAGTGEASGSDYRRAMLACIEGRGYSAN